MTIVYRAIKGSALTFAEMDGNIQDLYQNTTIDRVLGNGNTTTQSLTIGSITSTGTINANIIQQNGANVITSTSISTSLSSPPAIGSITPNTISGTTISGTTITGTTLNDTKGEIRLIPFNTQSGSYTLLVTDHGKSIITSSGVTVPSGVFTQGQNITIYNNSTSSSLTITQGSGVTMYQVGTTTTGNRTLANQGVATIICVGTNTFVITGGGVT
jgi:hypothetical protein